MTCQFLSCLVLFVLAGPLLAQTARKVEYNRDIRPLLADNCFLCHGPAQATRKADLRLDHREGATADLGGTQAIVPGKPAESEMWRRLTASDAGQRMPPASTGKKLTPAQLELLRLWMEERPTPRDTHVLVRGLYNKPGEKVTAGLPACLPPLPKDAPRNRLGLAR